VNCPFNVTHLSIAQPRDSGRQRRSQDGSDDVQIYRAALRHTVGVVEKDLGVKPTDSRRYRRYRYPITRAVFRIPRYCVSYWEEQDVMWGLGRP